ncbi:SDR family NAD(P)-dependent oxidoreductase [Chitinimonas lacunae]|uniref:SDR family NAD(P)-dependent oxidoreductase n=1 Tax=Chitinimonas lacunae TaxID=1963018 RepID=A0ABV8MS19_9NEIS
MQLFQSILHGKTVLVTGASSGIGRATAIELSRVGARLILNGRDPERLQQTLAQLTPSEHRVAAFALDDADELFERIKTLCAETGPLDGLFHAAGQELVLPARMTKAAQTETVFASSTFAAIGLGRAAASKGVLQDGASLVFMSSAAAHKGQAGMIAYSAAKAAIEGMVRSLACELAPRRIRVNAIAAGAIRSEMHERLSTRLSADALQDYEQRHLLGFGEPQDVANAVLFLLSDAAKWVTGATWAIDGGYTAR